MTSTSKGGFQPDSDVHITFEDQQKINKFARHNAKLEDYKDELKHKQNELKNLEEAADEIELITDEKIQFLIGEIFMFQDSENTQKCLEEAKQQIQKEIEEIEEKCSKLKEVMSDLKTQLYGKFGSHINLEADEE
ncbi:probable prefoldin subunit 4 isoform X1 [Homalodisca vitripennis]|uniref:Prefoldin subunit 4 n=1 Tax=Homalodisca liturata TaxID=320908 RepID=A0A1B6HCG7_9HEMI|nr:probable prefoldin subunit 4 isoform X1 [Homalodisca vitripennis]